MPRKHFAWASGRLVVQWYSGYSIRVASGVICNISDSLARQVYVAEVCTCTIPRRPRESSATFLQSVVHVVLTYDSPFPATMLVRGFSWRLSITSGGPSCPDPSYLCFDSTNKMR